MLNILILTICEILFIRFLNYECKIVRLALVACHISQRNQISLGIPESGPIRADRSRMLRERRKQCPGRECLSLALNN
jgi:hypothetical protein